MDGSGPPRGAELAGPVPEENKMTRMLEPMIEELGQEAVITKRILERVPADKLAWKPHAKSMSLGQLALHIANIPGDYEARAV
jgi:hypothetical protein